MSEHTSRNRKIAVVVVVAGLVLGGGGAALAYWTSTGTGTGTATTGENTDFVVTSSPVTGAALTPGGPSQSVAFNVENPSTGSQTLTAVVVTVANADGSTWTAVAGCSAADYTVGTPVVTYGVIAGGADVDGTVTVSMVNAASNQDACQGVDVPLHFTAN
jgi:hypothetical protein